MCQRKFELEGFPFFPARKGDGCDVPSCVLDWIRVILKQRGTRVRALGLAVRHAD